MNYSSVRSSNIDSVGYDESTSTLGVKFKDGSEYHYFNVPRNIYAGLIATNLAGESVGKYLNEHVKKPKFDYKKI